MDFRQKKDISRRIAKVQHIPTYRDLLRSRGSSDANKIIINKEELARSLVYNLLDFYSEEQILAYTSSRSSGASILEAPVAHVVRSIKKKIQRLKNILPSPGKIWTTLWSGLRTAYTLTVSTATGLWQNLKERLLMLSDWIMKHLRR